MLGDFEVDGSVGSCEMNAASSSYALEGTMDAANNNNNGVLTVAAGKNVYFFDGMASRQLLKTIETPYEVASVALHPERKQFVTGGAGDTWVRLYDYEDGKELGTLISIYPSNYSILDPSTLKFTKSYIEDSTVMANTAEYTQKLQKAITAQSGPSASPPTVNSTQRVPRMGRLSYGSSVTCRMDYGDEEKVT